MTTLVSRPPVDAGTVSAARRPHPLPIEARRAVPSRTAKRGRVVDFPAWGTDGSRTPDLDGGNAVRRAQLGGIRDAIAWMAPVALPVGATGPSPGCTGGAGIDRRCHSTRPGHPSPPDQAHSTPTTLGPLALVNGHQRAGDMVDPSPTVHLEGRGTPRLSPPQARKRRSGSQPHGPSRAGTPAPYRDRSSPCSRGWRLSARPSPNRGACASGASHAAPTETVRPAPCLGPGRSRPPVPAADRRWSSRSGGQYAPDRRPRNALVGQDRVPLAGLSGPASWIQLRDRHGAEQVPHGPVGAPTGRDASLPDCPCPGKHGAGNRPALLDTGADLW